MDQDETRKINVEVQTPTGRRYFFRLSRSTKLWKLMAAFADGLGINVNDVRLVRWPQFASLSDPSTGHFTKRGSV
ncbi:unnamed protein product [Linum trigynum]|uniref:Rad60/SUMO-like domain-containing protein n=1 Tax=Linum trigynum TaxID=586398 RepID=A0AAV2EG57_9ROSI